MASFSDDNCRVMEIIYAVSCSYGRLNHCVLSLKSLILKVIVAPVVAHCEGVYHLRTWEKV